MPRSGRSTRVKNSHSSSPLNRSDSSPETPTIQVVELHAPLGAAHRISHIPVVDGYKLGAEIVDFARQGSCQFLDQNRLGLAHLAAPKQGDRLVLPGGDPAPLLFQFGKQSLFFVRHVVRGSHLGQPLLQPRPQREELLLPRWIAPVEQKSSQEAVLLAERELDFFRRVPGDPRA